MKYQNGLTTTRLTFAKLDERKRHEHDANLPIYEMPRVLTYTDKQILELLGPAQTSVY